MIVFIKMESLQLKDLFELSKNNSDLVTIETTITSGLEKIAEEECKEHFGNDTWVVVSRGKIYFSIPLLKVCQVFSMRSIDNIYLLVYTCDMIYVSQKEDDLSLLKSKYSYMDWKKPLKVWKDVFNFQGKLFPTKEEYGSYLSVYLSKNINDPKKCKGEKERRGVSAVIRNKIPKLDGQESKSMNAEHSCKKENEKFEENLISDANVADEDKESTENGVNAVPKFRVTAKRVGTHSFSSDDVAKMFGAVIQEDFLWIVDLSCFNVEVMLDTIDSELIVSIALTKSSLHRRNLTSFGLTSLRATICYSLIRMANPQIGNIVLDPLAGSGSIPIEGALAYPCSYFLAGDSHDAACNTSSKNFNSISSQEKKFTADLLKWNAVSLPLKTSSVDIIVTDMPFGKRSGSKRSNKVLYPAVLKEFGRVVRKGSGKAVLLTADRRSFEMAHSMTKHLWKLGERRLINVGGLRAAVFLLIRTILD